MMQTRSRRPSFLLQNLNNTKKKSPTDDKSQIQDDSEMDDESNERLSMLSDDPVKRKLRKKVKLRNPMPNVMKTKPKVVPY